MAKQRRPEHPATWKEGGPYFYPPWREEFNSRSSWGPHPASNPCPNREWKLGDKGPTPKQTSADRDGHPGYD